MISRLVYSRLAVAKNHAAKRVSRLIVMSQICGVDITFLLFGGWDGIGHGGYLGSLHQISTTCFIFFMITFSFPAVQCKVWVLEYALGRPSPKYVETYISSYRCWVSMNHAFKNDQRLVTYEGLSLYPELFCWLSSTATTSKSDYLWILLTSYSAVVGQEK